MPPVMIFLLIIFTLVVISTILMVLLKVATWWGERHAPVSAYAYDDMSSKGDALTVEPLSSKDGQDSGRTDTQQVGRAELLTLYKVLRKYGVPREEIRSALKGVRVPLSNDVWKAAAPAVPTDDDVLVTPYAGRRTRASYYPDDPELEFQAP